MPVSSSIYSQLNQDTVKPLSPLEAQANAYKSQDLMVNSQIKQQGLMDDKAARQALIQSGGNQNKLLELYMQGGLGAQADALRKQMLDSETSRADIAQKGATTQKTLSEAEALKIGQHADILSQVQTPEQAIMWAKMGLDAGVLKPQQYQMALSNINKLQDPQSFEAWKQQAALGARKFIELNKPTYQERRLGGTSETLALPGLGGKPQVAYSAPITQSPDSIATNERIAREGALNRGQSERHFNTTQGVSGKPPSGYRQLPNGDLEAIPGGPADLKAQAVSGLKAAGVADVDSAIAVLRDAYDRLEKGGGITSTNKGSLSNIASSISSSGPGQLAGRALGTENQSARNDIAMTRPALLAALMKATGMSAKQMDSNAELKLWMATATDPTLDVESNRRALANIERKYMGGGSPSSAPGKPQASGNTVQTPDGQVLTFPNAAAAAAFKKAAGL